MVGRSIAASAIFKENWFGSNNSLGFTSVGAFTLSSMVQALKDFEQAVSSDIARFASCPSRVSIGLMLQLQLQINKMVQFSEQISGLLSNLNSIVMNSISNTRAS